MSFVTQSSSKTTTYEKTYSLYKASHSIEEIAQERGVSNQTIYNHLIKLYEDGKDINLYQFVTEYEIQQIKKARKSMNNTYQLKPIFDALKGEYEYHKINMAIAILQKQEKTIS